MKKIVTPEIPEHIYNSLEQMAMDLGNIRTWLRLNQYPGPTPIDIMIESLTASVDLLREDIGWKSSGKRAVTMDLLQLYNEVDTLRTISADYLSRLKESKNYFQMALRAQEAMGNHQVCANCHIKKTSQVFVNLTTGDLKE